MNQSGTLFRISLFGESHGPAIGVVVDGIPAGLPLDLADFEPDLARRRAGPRGTTSRVEADRPDILSGWYEGRCSGSPLCIVFRNHEQRSGDYAGLEAWPRPGHADMTAKQKYRGWNDPRGGGHFSGRLTLALVAAGVVAKKLITPTHIASRLVSVGGSANIDQALREAEAAGDSLGGLVELVASSVPAGLGEPFFDSLEGMAARLIFAIPGVRGVEFGDGFAAAAMRGSEHNDPIIGTDGRTAKNGAGGVNGGISNGNDILLRVAIKPTASIGLEQESLNLDSGKMEGRSVPGRHDTCIAMRAMVALESALAIVLADCLLQARACGERKDR